MKRYLQILGLVVLAFAASGWGSAVAAALCPHARASALNRPASESKLKAKPHCHDEMAMKEEAGEEGEQSGTMPERKLEGAALSLPDNSPCTHCISRPEAPASTVIARTKVEEKRVIDFLPVETFAPESGALSFKQPVLYRQGAPPGPATPRHLLIGLLLI
jgi:hypothetical protein